MMDSGIGLPESPMEQDDPNYPCKGCGEILEEGKAFELAGNRWHIDCFRCNTCGTLLDSDANLLLLGDGSLICNNCTYSCSACQNKIEDLAILTGDQAFCASCFRCRNCKKKIENLKYARTSQGIFCMDCHESLMRRRRKKSAKNSDRQRQPSNSSMLLHKSLPSLPPNAAVQNSPTPGQETPPSDTYSDTPTEQPKRPQNPRNEISRSVARNRSPSALLDGRNENLTLPAATYQTHRHSTISQRSDISGSGDDLFNIIPMTIDPNPAPAPPPSSRTPQIESYPEVARLQLTDGKPTSRDYFNAKSNNPNPRKASQAQIDMQSLSHTHSHSSSSANSPQPAQDGSGRETPTDMDDWVRMKPSDASRESVSGRHSRQGSNTNEKFRLQEVPKHKRGSKSDGMSPLLDTSIANSVVKEQVVTLPHGSPQSMQNDTPPSENTHPTHSRNHDNGLAVSPSVHSPQNGQLQLPQRADSLVAKQQVFNRKETTAMPSSRLAKSSLASDLDDHLGPLSAPAAIANGGKTISGPIESPSESPRDYLHPPVRARDRPSISTTGNSGDSFIAPRAPPQPPSDGHREKNNSISTLHSENVPDQPVSPNLPRYSAGGGFSMEEDMARILGSDDNQDHASFLRRVSHSVRHARSYSDRGTRLSREQKWPKSPRVGSAGTHFNHEISSPTGSSPDNKDDLMRVKYELRREKQKHTEKDQKIAELEAALDGKASIKEVNTELREKRSTMVFLDSQKELVVRELEALTEHIASAKRSGEPLDFGKLSTTVLRDFAESLQKLKDSFAPQIEELIQRRNDTLEELSGLSQLKERTLQEFEQLSAKNAQLADLNNQLVHQIQELYKANAGPSLDVVRPPPNGLGIYTHPYRDGSAASTSSREQRPSIAESGMTGSTLAHEQEAEPATILTAPQVVNIRKGQPKKFNWKKGGHNVAKGVTKGLKGAFASGDGNKVQQRDCVEGLPYGLTSQIQESQIGMNHDPNRQGFGFFNQKGRPVKTTPNGSTPTVSAKAASSLFGSELEQRADYENRIIPGIVTRCIQEVELRGMDIEGIYRKSGGSSQIEHIKQGFERNIDFDLSDPDLDISAITSALKSYLHKLPTPLITYPVYDKLLDAITHVPDNVRLEAFRSAFGELPGRHRDCLEFLIFHLARVVERSSRNLMTPLNVAVVFAPTIMRPESLTRELSENQMKNVAVEFLISNCQALFDV